MSCYYFLGINAIINALEVQNKSYKGNMLSQKRNERDHTRTNKSQQGGS